MTVRIAETDEDRRAALAVRYDVFVEGQGVDESLERDGDDESVHFLAEDGGRAVGAARLRPLEDDTAKVERVAVRESRRGEGWGRRLMDTLETHARERGFEKLRLHAQTDVEGFYHELDYRTESDVFEEAGIPHVEMEKELGD